MVKERKRACGRGGGGGGVVPRDLPHDLVAGEVLTRLPAKSLMRFKCVSKLWRSTISHPCFCKAHRARSRLSRRDGCGGLIMVFPETITDDDDNDLLVGVGFFYATLPSSQGPPVIDLLYQFRIGSPRTEEEEEGVSYMKDYQGYTRFINGLFCLYTADRVSICNFSTREIMDLPAPPTRPFQKCLHYLGFDSTTNEYKVLKVCSVKCRKDEEEEEGEMLTFVAPTHACIYSADKEPPKSSSDILQYPSASFGVNEGRLSWQRNRVSSGYKWRSLVQSFVSEIREKRVIHEWIVRQYCVS